MTEVVYTPAKISPVFGKYVYKHIVAVKLAEAVEAGNPLYILPNGKYKIADANASVATAQFRGIALSEGAINSVIDMLWEGWVEGFTLDDLDFGAKVYLSNTVGEYTDSAAESAYNVLVGRVVPLPDVYESKKLLYISTRWTENFS